MTPEAQRIAIAEAVGWTKQEVEASQCVRKLVAEYRRLPRKDSFSGLAIAEKIEKAECSEHYRGDLPNFCSDLNAMHAAEKAAFDGSQILWQRYLDDVLPTVVAERNAVECATAAQRAEAFLRTLGKFTE